MQLSAVLPLSEKTESTTQFPHQSNFSDSEAITALSMPESWVRGAMLVRCNSLLRGHSAVRLEVIETLMKILEHNLVPLVPLRGSVSASGDLCPLSYIAGTLEGNPDVRVWSGDRGTRKLISADKALESIGLAPIRFGPKECLGLLNGTAFSVAVASIAHHQADKLALLAQILTAMGTEALLGTAESFAPFIAAVRPHPGQIEVAANMRAFLKDSKLTQTGEDSGPGSLRQDRYALRTSSQWLGPGLEDMELSRRQLETELNSTTDNPLVDSTSKKMHHGGNFQAMSATSSTEKTRLSLEKIGKMLFAQSSELLNNHLAHGLPPNLAVDEPSLSYSMKGVDINIASYMSELSYLANPVSTHVLSAEMNNQAINSLALITARYTHTAVDIVMLMSSAYLYCLCQALDLRAMNAQFVVALRPKIEELTSRTLAAHVSAEELAALHSSVWAAVLDAVAATTSMDSAERFNVVARSAQHLVVGALQGGHLSSAIKVVADWTAKLSSITRDLFRATRAAYLVAPDATPYLGLASSRMYSFVRSELRVPIHRGIVDHPTAIREEGMLRGHGNGEKLVTTGTQISRIYAALRDERLTVPMIECLAQATEMQSSRLGRAKL